MTKNILHNIEKNMSSFSKGQKLIARFILENYDKAAFMTASKLGKTVQVSESTVVRFATQLGYEYAARPAGDDPRQADLHPAHPGVRRRACGLQSDDERSAARYGKDPHGHRPDRERGV